MSKPRTIKGKGWRNGQYQCGWQDDGKSFEEILQLDKFKATGGSRAVRREQTMKALLHWMRGQIRAKKCNWSLYNTLKDEICGRMKAGHPMKDVKASVDAAIASGAGARSKAEERKVEDRFRRMEEASIQRYNDKKQDAAIRQSEANDNRNKAVTEQSQKLTKMEPSMRLQSVFTDNFEMSDDHWE
ncbi:hypothetical protein NKI31_13395 [Mesorhizobium sp. M0659]|uniref:hypothetical protein n=1 Tax=Mesorhizobium sp. M0659 TaxID=2956980 RepID=UPI00333C2D76